MLVKKRKVKFRMYGSLAQVVSKDRMVLRMGANPNVKCQLLKTLVYKSKKKFDAVSPNFGAPTWCNHTKKLGGLTL